MQYFVGLPGYQMEAPFAPSLFVEIRKRMGQSVFEGFHQSHQCHSGIGATPTAKVTPNGGKLR